MAKKVGELFVELKLSAQEFASNLRRARDTATQTIRGIQQQASQTRLSMTLSLNAERFRQEFARLQADAVRRANETANATRDANGRLRDEMGRFVQEGNKGILGLNIGFGGLVSAIAASTAALQALNAVQFGVNFNAQLETSLQSFETLLKSADAAKAMVKDLQQFAATTPFEFAGVQQSAKTLLAMGIAADQIMPSMNSIGNAVAAVGGTDEQLQRISLAIGQISTKGRISAEEMNQLAENGIPAWGILSEKMNLSTQELMKLGEQGKLLSTEALPLLLDGLNERYAGGIEKQAQTFTGMMNTFIDSLKIFAGEATEPLFQGLKQSLDGILDTLKEMQGSGELKQFSDTIGAGLKAIFDGAVIAARGIVGVASAIRENWQGLTVLITSVAAGFAAFKVVTLVAAAFKAYKTGVMAATVAQWAFNAAQYANPVTWIALAIAGVVAAIVGLVVAWKTNFGNIQERTKALVDTIIAYFRVWKHSVLLVIHLVKLGFLKMAEFVMEKINNIVQAIPFISDSMKESMNNAFESIKQKSAETTQDITNDMDSIKFWSGEVADSAYGIVKAYQDVGDVWANFKKPWFADSNDPKMKKLIEASKQQREADEREKVAKAQADKRRKDAEIQKEQEKQKKIQEAQKKSFDTSKNWIADQKEFWGMSLKEELAAWERVQKRFAKGTEERKEADRELMRVQIDIAREAAQKQYNAIQESVEKEKKSTLDLIESKKSTYESDFENQSKVLEKKSKAVIKSYQDEKKALEDSRDTKKFDKEQQDLNTNLTSLETEYNKYKNAISLQGQQKAADILEKMNDVKQKIQENADERAFKLQMDTIDKNIETEQNRYDAEKEEREKQRTDTLAFYEQQRKDAEQKYIKIEEENKKHFENLGSNITAYNTNSITSLNAGQDGILKMLEGKAQGYFDTGKKIGESFKTGIESALNAAQTAATEKMKQVNAMMNPLVQTLSGGNNAMNSVGGYQSGQAGLGFVGASFGALVTVQNMNVNNGTDSKVVAYDIANTANARLRSFGVKG